MAEGETFISGLMEKLAAVKRIEAETGKPTKAAQSETKRQIGQAMKGNPITGKGVTKSGKED